MSITADQWVSNNINIVQGDQCQKHYTVHGRVVPENGTKHAEVFQASKSSLNLPFYLTEPSVVLLSLVSCGIRPAKKGTTIASSPRKHASAIILWPTGNADKSLDSRVMTRSDVAAGWH